MKKTLMIIAFIFTMNANAYYNSFDNSFMNTMNVLGNTLQNYNRATQCATRSNGPRHKRGRRDSEYRKGIVCALPYNANVKIGGPCWCPSYDGPVDGVGASFIQQY